MPSRWAPFAEIASALHRRRSSLSGRHRLAIDVSEDKECCYVKASVPGFLPEQLRVDIQDNVLTISGLRRADDTAHDAGAQGGEQTDVHFTRSFVLPPEAACELAEATLDDEALERQGAKDRDPARAGQRQGPRHHVTRSEGTVCIDSNS